MYHDPDARPSRPGGPHPASRGSARAVPASGVSGPGPRGRPPLMQSPGHTDATPQFHRLRTPAGRGWDRGFQAFVVSAASLYGRPPIRGFVVWLGGPSAASLHGIQCNERSDRSHLDTTNTRIQRAVGTHEATNRPGATAPRTVRPHSRTSLTQGGSAVRSPRAFCVERPLANGFRPTEASWRATVHSVGALCVKKLLPSALTVRTYHRQRNGRSGTEVPDHWDKSVRVMGQGRLHSQSPNPRDAHLSHPTSRGTAHVRAYAS